MTQHILYNFDHGIKHPCKVDLGPFTIIINETHCENLVKIPHDKQYNYTYETSDLTPIIKEEPIVDGGWIETSIIEIGEKKLKKASLYSGNEHNNIDDLCLILSFLTGRRVLHENDKYIKFRSPNKHVDKVVYRGFIQSPVLKWENVEIIKKRKLEVQLYNLTLSYECNELIAKGAYVNSVFNVLYEKHFSEKELKKRIKEKAEGKIIENDLKNEIKNISDEYFKKNNIHPIVKDDFKKKFGILWAPTAMTKAELFLESIGLFHGYTTIEKGRLDWLLKVRNKFAHNGDIPYDEKYSVRMRMEISASILSVVLRIAQYYFASQILKIDDPYLNYIKNGILEYFNKGIFFGQKVFDETFEQYMERTKKEWLGIE